MISAGKAVFSPIVHGHPLLEQGILADWSFWRRIDGEHLLRCDEVVVLVLDGGTRAEGAGRRSGWRPPSANPCGTWPLSRRFYPLISLAMCVEPYHPVLRG